MICRALGFLWLTAVAVLTGQISLQDAVSRADALASQGKYHEAARAYDRALSLADPYNEKLVAGLYYELARAKGNAGDILGALDEIQRALSFDHQQAYATLKAELEHHQATSKTVTKSQQIRDALASVKGSRSIRGCRWAPTSEHMGRV